MNKEEQFYPDRSSILGKLIDFIFLCQEVDRNVGEELEEVIYEALKESNLNLNRKII